VVWDTFAGAVTGRRSWLLALAAVLLGVGAMALIGENAAARQAPMSVPAESQSAEVDALVRQFPGGEEAMLILVVSRADNAVLGTADVAAAQAARDRMQAVAQPAAAPALVSHDGKAALAVVPVSAKLSGLPLSETVTSLRKAADMGLPADLRANVTGGPAFGADIANAFTNANVTLLAVTASIVALLLIATYRSPVLWLAPLLVVGFADRVAGDWAGPGSRVVRRSMRLAGSIYAGDTMIGRGRAVAKRCDTSVDPPRYLLDIEIEVTNQHGVLCCPVQLTLQMPCLTV